MTLDEKIQEDDVRDLLKEVMVAEDLQDAEIEFQSGSNVGDGFLGVTSAVEVKNSKKNLKLFIKTAPTNEKLRVALLSPAFFQQEMYFYDQIVPKYEHISLSKTGKPLNLTPKCYALNFKDKKEAMVLENLREQGFRLFDKTLLMNEEHVLLVLRSLAKLHGVSYALKDQFPEVFKDLCGNLEGHVTGVIKNMNFMDALVNFVKTLEKYLEDEIDRIHWDKLEELCGKLIDLIEECKVYEDTYRIIMHGDSWGNNILFKYKEDNETPIDIRFLDFQLCRPALPVYDLSYFFFISACSEENIKKLDYYLQYYHSHLLEFINGFGSDAEKIYPYDVFVEHWKKFCKYGLLWGIGMGKVALSEGDETPNVAKKIINGEKYDDEFNVQLADEEVFVDRIKHSLFYFVKNNLL